MTRSKYLLMLAVAGLMAGLGFSAPHEPTAFEVRDSKIVKIWVLVSPSN